MSQVVAAQASAHASARKRVVETVGRPQERFSSVLEMLRKPAGPTNGPSTESDHRLSEAGTGRSDRQGRARPAAEAESGARRAAETGRKPDRLERLRDSAAREQEAVPDDSSVKEPEAQPPAETDGRVRTEEPAREGRPADDGTQEETTHEPDQEPAQDPTPATPIGWPVIIVDTGEPTPDRAFPGGTAPRSDGVGLPAAGGAVPVQTAPGPATGEVAGASVPANGPAIPVGGVQPPAPGPSRDPASEKNAARPEAPASHLAQKPAEGGGDFHSMVSQGARARSMNGARLPAGPAPADQPEIVRMASPEAPEELARVVRSQVGARHSSLTLQLDPPELGRVRVAVQMHADVMTVRFQAETEAGHDALQGRLRELTGALEQQGIRLDRVEVEHRPPAPPESPRENPSGWQHGGAGGDSRFAGARDREGAWTGPGSEFAGGSNRPAASMEASVEMRPAPAWETGVDVVV